MSDILFQDLNLFRKKYAQLHSYDFDNAVSAMCWGDRACTKVLACSHDLRGKCHEVQLLTVPALCADPDNTVFLNQDVDLDLGGFSDLPVFDVTLVEEGEFPIFATARRLSGTSCQFDLWKLDSDSVLFAPAAALTTPSIPAGQAAMCSSHGRSGGCHVAVAYQETATRCPRLAAKEESLPGLRAPTVEDGTRSVLRTVKARAWETRLNYLNTYEDKRSILRVMKYVTNAILTKARVLGSTTRVA
eukprot:Rmarinus@m.28094